jgi:prolyl-tRNA synthetase
MRLSTLLGKTLRQPPADARLRSQQLLVRAGYVRALEAGLFASLPLGQRALHRLQSLTRRELTRLGGQEIDVPPLPDTEPRAALVRLVRREVDSYRQLPVLLFEMGPRALPQPSTRAGLFGASQRPFSEIHAFGGADPAIEQKVTVAIDRVLAACDLAADWAEAGDGGHRAYYAHPSGDEDLVRCSACGYATERSWATTSWPEPPDEQELPTEEIATPGCDTIDTLAEFLDIPSARTLKMVFYSVEGKVTCVVIRGDRTVDEAKLVRVLGTDWYYASLEDELAAVGAVGGYASPIGLDSSRVRVVADPSVRSGKNFVSGANRPDYHIQNVNVPRDFVPGEWADLALIEPGDPCPQCGGVLEVEPAFALADSTRPAPCKPDAEYLDAEGRGQALWTASWCLDLGRLMAAVVEGHHDDYGIIWPAACAPFDVHLVALDVRKEMVAAQADALYNQLQAGGFSVLYDDRNASAGVKFNDADLIGIPLRLTVSKRSAKEGLIEAKWRDGAERLKLDDDGLASELTRLRAE